MNHGEIQAIVFDLYGVLALNGWQAFKAKHFTTRPETWDSVFELGRKVDAGLADYDELIRFTAEHTGETEDTVRYQLEHTIANDALLDYIRTDLKQKYHVGILSNASSNKVIDHIFTKDQEALFDVITLSHHVGLTKPDARMYEAIADKLGVPIEACVFIDDQERHVAGAHAAGMRGLVFTDVPALQKDLGHVLA